MSRAQIATNYAQILTRWPKDVLRPNTTFSALLEKRVKAPPIPFRNEEREVIAATQLLDNTFSNRAALPQKLLRPQSNPDYYENLRKELEEMPNRTWLQNFVKRLQNMVRLQ